MESLTGRRLDEEIEITPEMIEAVAAEIRLYDPTYPGLNEVAEDVIKVVLASLPRRDPRS